MAYRGDIFMLDNPRRRQTQAAPTKPVDTGLITGIYERATLTIKAREGTSPFNRMTMGIDRYVLVGGTLTPVRTLFIPSFVTSLIRNTIHVNVNNVDRIEWNLTGYDYSVHTTLDVVEISWDGYNKYRKLSGSPYELSAGNALEALYWITPGSITSSNVNNILNVTRVENGTVLEISPGANFPAADEEIKIYF